MTPYLPPRLSSPSLPITSTEPSLTNKTDTSSVPPPRSYTRMWLTLGFRCRPNARAAAVGSSRVRITCTQINCGCLTAKTLWLSFERQKEACGAALCYLRYTSISFHTRITRRTHTGINPGVTIDRDSVPTQSLHGEKTKKDAPEDPPGETLPQ